APETLTQVFSMFTRVESETSRAEGGLGIGLALAKGLVALHGGQLTAHSAGLDQGSEFVVSLPRFLIVENPRRAPSARHNGEDLPARRVLIADDNHDGAETLGLYLQLQGHEIHFAHSGLETLTVAAAVKPEVGVIDIGLPDMN